jgi:hypothetical protein
MGGRWIFLGETLAKIFAKRCQKKLNFGHANGSKLSLKRPNLRFFAVIWAEKAQLGPKKG